MADHQRFRIADQSLDAYEGGKVTAIGNHLGEVINSYGSIKWLSEAQIVKFTPDFWYSLRSKLAKYIQNWLPGDVGGLAVGILLGGSGLLSRDLNNAFRTVGLSHIVAASGFNLIFVIGWINALGTRFWKKNDDAVCSSWNYIVYVHFRHEFINNTCGNHDYHFDYRIILWPKERSILVIDPCCGNHDYC